MSDQDLLRRGSMPPVFKRGLTMSIPKKSDDGSGSKTVSKNQTSQFFNTSANNIHNKDKLISSMMNNVSHFTEVQKSTLLNLNKIISELTINLKSD